MVYSEYRLKRILVLHRQGLKAPTIKKILDKEGLPTTRVGIHTFLERFKASGCLMRKPGSGRPSKITREIKAIVEQLMRLYDETTAYQLHRLLVSKGCQISKCAQCIVITVEDHNNYNSYVQLKMSSVIVN